MQPHYITRCSLPKPVSLLHISLAAPLKLVQPRAHAAESRTSRVILSIVFMLCLLQRSRLRCGSSTNCCNPQVLYYKMLSHYLRPSLSVLFFLGCCHSSPAISQKTGRSESLAIWMPGQAHRHASLCASCPSPQMRVYKLLQSTGSLLQNALPLPEAFFVGSIWFYYF